MHREKTYALITGACIGLGRAFSLELASRKCNLLLLALKDEGLSDFSEAIQRLYHVDVHYLEVDFTWSDALQKTALWIKPFEIDMLINNAGIGGSDYFDKAAFTYIDAIIQINVRTVSLITHLLLPKLKKHDKAYVLNVGSMASFSPIAYKTVYPASKAFIYFFSRGLAEELKKERIQVCVFLPGPIKTNDEVSKRIDQQGYWVKAGLQTPEQLAAIAIRKLLKQRKVIIPGLINKINWVLIKLLPAAIRVPLVSNAVEHEIRAVQCVA